MHSISQISTAQQRPLWDTVQLLYCSVLYPWIAHWCENTPRDTVQPPYSPVRSIFRKTLAYQNHKLPLPLQLQQLHTHSIERSGRLIYTSCGCVGNRPFSGIDLSLACLQCLGDDTNQYAALDERIACMDRRCVITHLRYETARARSKIRTRAVDVLDFWASFLI